MEGHVKSTSASGRSVSRWLETRPRAGTDDGNHPDIRGSAEPLPQSSETSPPSRLRLTSRVGYRIGSSRVLGENCRPRPRPQPVASSSSARLHSLTDSPDEAGQFPGHGCHCLGSTNSAVKVAVAAGKTRFGSEGELDAGFGEA